MRRIVIMLMALLMVPQVVFAEFSDVPQDFWAYECIEEMQSLGVIDGYEDASFRPDGFVTIAETARILCDIAKLPEGSGEYSDVSEDDWYFTYARDCGEFITDGDEFLGNKLMTREGLANAVVKILKLDTESTLEAELFSDFESFKNPKSIAAAVKKGFVSGYEDGTFRPSGAITRAEVCSMLQRAFEGYKPSENKETTWTVRKLANAKLDNFQLNAVLDEKGKLVFTEPSEEEELLFQIDLPKGETQRKTMWRLKRFFFKTDENNEKAGYTDFVPHSVFYNNFNNKTHLFGRFRVYTAPDGSTYEVNKYVVLDLTVSLDSYAEFEEGKVQYNDKYYCIPELVYIHNEEYTVVYDGKNSVYRFDIENSTRQGRLYHGKEDTFRGFLSIGERMFGVDDGYNLSEYDFEALEWKKPLKTFDADVVGTRDNKFWLWDTEKGEIYTSTPDGNIKAVHKNVTFDSIEVMEGADISGLDSHMLIYDENTFILYNGKAFLILEKK